MSTIISWIEKWSLSKNSQKVNNESNFLIRTLDNPGWEISINIEGTELGNKLFTFNNIERSEDDWLHCSVKKNVFKAFCGPANLIEVLLVFINWFNKENEIDCIQNCSNENSLEWLQKWYLSNCNGDWEHIFGVSIETTEDPGWDIAIELEETELEDKVLMPISINKADNDWLKYEIDRKGFPEFHATCSLNNLNKVLEIFINWANANLSD